ncbi:MAG: sigma-70 family RNA polymerase sigma factor [Kiritimatiellae bacterium]|nr:sigma-70 family RNA polymerase sigma factor [Kiritimatiellia bacterium]
MNLQFDIESDIQAAKTGDMTAYGRLIRSHEKMLLVFATYRIPVREEACEAVQDTFIRAYEQIGDFRTGADFGVWLRSICRYMVLNRITEYTRRRKKHDNYKEQLSILAVNQVSSTVIDDPTIDPLAQLTECMSKLNDQSRELITDRYHNTLSIHEISKKTGRTNTWVTSTLHRVRSVLKTCIEKHIKEMNHEQ